MIYLGEQVNVNTVSSANLNRWIRESNFNQLNGAVLEGHGDRLKSKFEYYSNEIERNDDETEQNENENAKQIRIYIDKIVPRMMNKIRIIHAAVSCGDLIALQDNLKDNSKEKDDYISAKDHLGMTPLHKATILGHLDVVQFILEKFPESVNSRDREGRTPLHYAAATTNRNGNIIYRMLIRSGGDQRIKDSVKRLKVPKF